MTHRARFLIVADNTINNNDIYKVKALYFNFFKESLVQFIKQLKSSLRKVDFFLIV